MKLVINKCYGGFGLSDEACERLISLGVPRVPMRSDYTTSERVIFDVDHPETEESPSVAHLRQGRSLYGRYTSSWFREDAHRGDADLVRVVEELGDKANGRFAKLRIVEVPDGIEWEIDEYDGMERVNETHRSWG